MNLKTSLEALAFAALSCASVNSHAAFTVFTSQESFLAAVTAPGVDTFAGLSTTSPTLSPITRSAGPYTYTASSTTSFFGAGTAANPALSTNVDTDMIMFFDITGGASAIGGLFFGSDVLGNFTGATIILTATDALGAASTQTVLATPTTFVGFVSTAALVSLDVAAAMPGEFIFPTVDDLTVALASTAPVPEPETWALVLAGLGLLGLRGRKRPA